MEGFYKIVLSKTKRVTNKGVVIKTNMFMPLISVEAARQLPPNTEIPHMYNPCLLN